MHGLSHFSPGWLTWDWSWAVINDHDCWPGKKGWGGGKDKCYQGNRDIVLNIPVTVIEECLCVGMSCPNMCLCMWQWAAAWRECVWRQLMFLLCSASVQWCVLRVYTLWLFTARLLCSHSVPCPCIIHSDFLLHMLNCLCGYASFLLRWTMFI